jgi:hypothetical protein
MTAAAKLPTREQARDMADAHIDGYHDEYPREFCPECEGRDVSEYPRADDVAEASQ